MIVAIEVLRKKGYSAVVLLFQKKLESGHGTNIFFLNMKICEF